MQKKTVKVRIPCINIVADNAVCLTEHRTTEMDKTKSRSHQAVKLRIQRPSGAEMKTGNAAANCSARDLEIVVVKRKGIAVRIQIRSYCCCCYLHIPHYTHTQTHLNIVRSCIDGRFMYVRCPKYAEKLKRPLMSMTRPFRQNAIIQLDFLVSACVRVCLCERASERAFHVLVIRGICERI